MKSELLVELLLQGAFTHKTTGAFWKSYNALPEEIRDRADKQFALLIQNPHHPSVNFTFLRDKKVWEAYVTNRGVAYRALARQTAPGVYIWFWIGTHRDKEAMLRGL